jgi:MoaA/NifB/PqqE/SkfB family radical SAM enzyme
MFNIIKTLHFEPTSRCNAACPQCARYTIDGDVNPNIQLTDLTLSDIQQYLPVEFIQSLDKMFMCGNFGDPTVAKQCKEIVEYFKSTNPTIAIGMNTNGSTRTTEWWSSLGSILSNEKDYVVFSLDGLEDTNHIYRRNTNWQKIIENAKAFINSGGNAHWDMLVFDHNEHQIEEAKQLAKDLGFKWFRYKVSRRFNSIPILNLNKPKNFDATVNFTDKISCHAMNEQSIYLDAHGHLLPCCFIGNDVYSTYDEKSKQELHDSMQDLSKFNIKTNDFGDILNHKFYGDIMRSWDNNPYKVCSKSCRITDNKNVFSNQWRGEFNLKLGL